MKTLTTFLLFLLTTASFAQQNPEDSLLSELPGASLADSFTVYLKLVQASRKDPEQALTYGEELHRIATALNNPEELAIAKYELGKALRARQEFDKAETLLQEAVDLLIPLPDKNKLARTYSYLGLNSRDLGNFDKAEEYYFLALDLYKSLNLKSETANMLINLGVLYRIINDSERAIDAYLQALKIHEESGEKRGMALVNGNLGNLYREQGELDKALVYYREASRGFNELGRRRMEAVSLNNIGLINDLKNNKDLALIYYKEALIIFEELQLYSYAGTCLNNMGVIYYNLKDYQQALQTYLKALNIFKLEDNQVNTAKVKCNIGACYLQTGLLEQGHAYLLEALDEARELDKPDIVLDCYENLCRYHELKNEYKTALGYYRKFDLMRDSMFNIEKVQQISEIESRFELDKKEQENALLRKNEDVKNAIIQKKEFQNRVLVTGAIFLLAFAAYFYQVTRQKRKTNQLLQQQNEEIIKKQQEIITINVDLKNSQKQLHVLNEKLLKLNSSLEAEVAIRTEELQKTNQELDTFLYQSSHALRRPLVQILGLLSLAQLEKEKDEVALIYSQLGHTTSAMDNMLKKLVMASEINFSTETPEQINFSSLLEGIWQDLSAIHHLEEVSMAVITNLKEPCYFNLDLISFTLYNLLENAALHGKSAKRPKQLIEVVVSQDEQNIFCRVTDNGPGIGTEVISDIFQMFTVVSHVQKGNGLGLYIVQKAVKKMKGEIYVESTGENGTTFLVVLPVQQQPSEETTGEIQIITPASVHDRG